MFPFFLLAYITLDAEGRISKQQRFSSSGIPENFPHMEGISRLILCDVTLTLH